MDALLLTGFEAFAGRSENRTQHLLKLIDSHWPNSSTWKLYTLTLPVLFESAASRLIEYSQQIPNLARVISLGECPSPEIRVETRAHNVRSTSEYADNAGIRYSKPTPIRPGHSEYLELDSSFGIHFSNDAGSFVCNDLAYLAQDYFQKVKIPYSFIHVPHLEVSSTKSSEQIAQEILELLSKKLT